MNIRRRLGRRRSKALQGPEIFDNLDKDQLFIKCKKYGYLMNYLQKSHQIPEKEIFSYCLTFISAKAQFELLKRVARHAKALKKDITTYLEEEEMPEYESDSEEVLADLYFYKAFLRKFMFKKIMRALARQQNIYTSIPEDAPFYQRLLSLGTLFHLNSEELEVLTLINLNEMDTQIEELLDAYDKKSHFKRYPLNLSDASLSCVSGLSMRKVISYLSPKSTISRLELVDDSRSAAEELLKFLNGSSATPITDTYFLQTPVSNIPIDNFFIPEKELNVLTGIIRSKHPKTPLNILFYGEPGTGKSELASALGKHLGFQMYTIKNPGDEGKEFRIRALTACRNMADPEKTLMIMDEADDMLETQGWFFFSSNKKDKGKVNMMLEEGNGKIVWIVNRWQDIDESTLRRFDYSLHFPKMTFSQRKSVWITQLNENRQSLALSDTTLDELATKYEVNAGGIAFALKNAGRLHNEGASETEAVQTIETLLKSHVKLLHGDKELGKNKSNAPVYSLEGLNISSDIDNVMKSLKKFNHYWQEPASMDKVSNLNLLLHGPPGTGKTEFARYVSRELNRKLVVKNASDLLDCYVGESEKHIRDAFREAERERAVLFFDEADSLLAGREGAVRSWEVTQVNEVLSNMENFKGIFICATNFKKNLDSASLRRFSFKLAFDFLEEAGNIRFYELFLLPLVNTVCDKSYMNWLKNLRGLTPGDFKAVYNRYFFQDSESLSHELLIKELEDEVKNKDIKDLQKMGF
ncbi:MAG: ATP-binding protein [Fibrobacteria bacterium]|nr:ATP-binding protein [Fibrobacteria bacterium]